MRLLLYVVFNLIFYSFIGWIIEEAYSYIVTKKFQEEGFLFGPFKPMYGIAFTLLIVCNEVLNIDGIPLIILCFLIPTTVEYISGYILKHEFNKVYWDYSNFKYNIHGYVTLRFSLYWMLLSFLGIYFFQSILHRVYIQNQVLFNLLAIAGAIEFTVDFYLTLKKLEYEKLKAVK
ncbi:MULTISPECIES: putative ABC transporter permease [unclassified Clostridium]|uniref:putative ABC transporter permease n=1 Tax=unclassified Clostridium TaxID=2614128 RepID=UPI000297DED5|nr:MULTISPECIES: putative ABC transporter permease [unclassified Clostridium]EKQ50586.1 MAG: putative membrane protein [Clostridium sp. Maddingley MBC34-26]